MSKLINHRYNIGQTALTGKSKTPVSPSMVLGFLQNIGRKAKGRVKIEHENGAWYVWAALYPDKNGGE
jgi:hypothetical protein